MRASEVYFLRAEAALRWEGKFGDAASLYKQGVAMSFEENGVSESVDDYLDTDNEPVAHDMKAGGNYSYYASKPTGATTRFSGTDEEKLEKIMIQKWIALYPNGQEAWTEWRRTGYPKLNPVQRNNGQGQGVTSQGGIRRMVYPNSFSQSDAAGVANYNAAVSLLKVAEDSPITKLWWDCKTDVYE